MPRSTFVMQGESMPDLTTAKTEDLRQYHEAMQSLWISNTLSKDAETEWGLIVAELVRQIGLHKPNMAPPPKEKIIPRAGVV